MEKKAKADILSMNLSWQHIHVNAVTAYNILYLAPEEYVAGSKTGNTAIHVGLHS